MYSSSGPYRTVDEFIKQYKITKRELNKLVKNKKVDYFLHNGVGLYCSECYEMYLKEKIK